MSNEPQQQAGEAAPNVKIYTVWGTIIIMVLGLVVWYNYIVAGSLEERAETRLPLIHRLEDNLILTERSGETVELAQLRGKVLVAAYVFTRCPRGCSGVVEEMDRLRQRFADDAEHLHLLSFTVDPEHDDPAQMAAFAERLGVGDAKNWWFLTGDKTALHRYMTRQFRFREVLEMPEEEMLSEDDLFIHDLRLALVDHTGHVRGHYDIMSVDPEFAKLSRESLVRDVRFLLDQTAAE